jgi:hypothetical protein
VVAVSLAHSPWSELVNGLHTAHNSYLVAIGLHSHVYSLLSHAPHGEETR